MSLLAILAHEALAGRVLATLLVQTKPTAELVGASQCVRARERHDVLVGEAHAVEDVPQVLLGRAGTARPGGPTGRQVALLRTVLRSPRIQTTITHGNLGAAGHLDGCGAGHLHEVGPADLGEGRLDGLQQVQGVLQTRVGTVVDLRLETDRPVGTAAVGPIGHRHLGVIRARVVPGQPDEDGVAVHLVDHLLQHLLALLEPFDGWWVDVHAVRRLPLAAQLTQRLVGHGVVFEECRLVGGVLLGKGLEGRIFEEALVGVE
mmetsp:Transcript_3719/g.8486  ORF Transcript_3719/g.8486 Transcript_3719/m.8486 type:complete len:261 (-) Transcript_3719:816-1598(-)